MTIIEVAKRAGVSKATVSRVINQRGNVASETVRAVQKAMEETNYLPPIPRPGRRKTSNPPVARPQKLSAFALVMPKVEGALFPSVQQGFEEAARELHHQIVVCTTGNDVHRQANTIIQLLQKRVAGVALIAATAAPSPPDHVQVLQDAGVPVVMLHRPIPGVRAPLIQLPFERIGQEVGRLFLKHGHYRAAFFSRIQSPSSQLLESALREVLVAEGGELPEELVYYGNPFNVTMVPDEQAGVDEALERMLSLPENRKPTAIYASDALAEFIYLNLLRIGVRIGEDISLLGFGSRRRDSAIARRLSSVTVDEVAVGRHAANLLLQICDGDRAIDSDERFFVPLDFYPGQTLRSPQR